MPDKPNEQRGSKTTERRRIIDRQWLRDPKGKMLPRPPPVGVRTPNGLIWGHSTTDFMWIQRIPDVNVMTVWSRSMIKEFGENYDEGEFDRPEPRPRVRKPWPVLRLQKGSVCKVTPPLGALDEDSDHEDDELRTWRWHIRPSEYGLRPDDLGEDEEDLAVVDNLDDFLVPNDGPRPIMSPLHYPYAALWRPDHRAEFELARKLGVWNKSSLIRPPDNRPYAQIADTVGLMAVIVLEKPDLSKREPDGSMHLDTFSAIRQDYSRVLFIQKRKQLESNTPMPEPRAEESGGKSEEQARIPGDVAVDADAAASGLVDSNRDDASDVAMVKATPRGVGAANLDVVLNSHEGTEQTDAKEYQDDEVRQVEKMIAPECGMDTDGEAAEPGSRPGLPQEPLESQQQNAGKGKGKDRAVDDEGEDDPKENGGKDGSDPSSTAPNEPSLSERGQRYAFACVPSVKEQVPNTTHEKARARLFAGAFNEVRVEANGKMMSVGAGPSASAPQEPSNAEARSSDEQKEEGSEAEAEDSEMFDGDEDLKDAELTNESEDDKGSEDEELLGGSEDNESLEDMEFRIRGASLPEEDVEFKIYDYGRRGAGGGKDLRKEEPRGNKHPAQAGTKGTPPVKSPSKGKDKEATEVDESFDEEILAELPKLEEFIPEEYFPDALMVHRVDEVPMKYVRILPKFRRDNDEGQLERLGHLYLTSSVLGVGNHSHVRRAPLELPSPLSACGKHRMVTVAAKTAFLSVSARKFLRHEAKIFSLFPRHLQEEYCGYNLVTPIRHPVPVGAVVPKFFGYYVPVENGRARDKTYESSSLDDHSRVSGKSPVLLMEECGQPVKPSRFSVDDRSECYSLVVRLQLAQFHQGSMYVRNILWQPGPLSRPPEQRSQSTPSFRIIDFGRARQWDDYVECEKDDKKRKEKAREWEESARYDRNHVESELLIEHWNY